MFFIFAWKLWVNRPSRTTSNYHNITLGDTKQSACSRASTRCGQKAILCISGWRYWYRMAHTRFTWNRNQFVQGVPYIYMCVCVSAVLFIYVYTISGPSQATDLDVLMLWYMRLCRSAAEQMTGKKWLYTISKLVAIPALDEFVTTSFDDERRDVSSHKTKTLSIYMLYCV